MTPLLTIKNLNVSYNAVQALKNVSMEVYSGEIVALIGANGAGKTTLLKTISGLLTPTQGDIRYHHGNPPQETSLLDMESHERVQTGIVQSPEGRMIFPQLTVLENLNLGAFVRKFSSTDQEKAEKKKDFENIFALFPRLQERLEQMAGTLSGGEQQMLSIGRALMAHPRLLLLDEPSLGIAPTLVQQIFKSLLEINKQGTTLLLVEQDARLALKSSHRAYVLETGSIILEGLSSELLQKPEVQAAYLGKV